MNFSSTFFTSIVSAILLSGVYSNSVPKIAGGSQSLNAFQGKKIMVVTLPTTQSDYADSTLYSLDTIASNHPDLRIIAVPAIEDGFSTSNQAALKTWYESKLAHGIIITGGIYTRKTSGSQQHNLMKWLTMVSKNDVFDIDVAGPGYKFVVSETGELNAVLLPQTKMWSRSVTKALQ